MSVIALLALLLGLPQGRAPDVQPLHGVVRDQTGAVASSECEPRCDCRGLRLESVVENGKTHYEGQIRTKAGKKMSMELDAAGSPIKK